MLKTIFVSVVLMWSFSAYASSVDNNNNAVNETPYEWLVRSHAEKPIDFIGLAAEASEMRARYNRTCLNILLSDELSTEEKYDFNLRLNPSDKYKLMLFENEMLRIQSLGGSVDHQKRRASIACSSVAGRVALEEDASAAEMTLVERIVWIARSADIWDFLARSLKSYKNEENLQDLALTKHLLLESWMALSESITSIWEAQNIAGLYLNSTNQTVVDKRLADELDYNRCVLESIMLHVVMVLKLSEDKLPLKPLIYDDLEIESVTELGKYFGLYLVDNKLSRLTSLTNVILKERSRKRRDTVSVQHTKKDPAMVALTRKLEHQGHMKNSFVDLLGYDQASLESPLFKNPRIRAFAPKFTLSSKCLSFEEFYQPLLKLEMLEESRVKAAERAERQKLLDATKESRANSFLSSMATQPARKPQKGKNKGGKKPVRPVESKQVTNVREEPVEPPVSHTTVVEQKEKKEKIKQPTSKQKREAKKEAKQEKFNQAVAERLAVADRNEQAQKRMIEGIQVSFGSIEPSLEELNLYAKIWGPASERKTMSWGVLRSELEGYGWTFSYNDGSFIIMTPPTWFKQVNVVADPALQMNFRYTKFMIHKPHDDALAPMPVYVIPFLREELAGAIGLSEIMVNAMIRKIDNKK